MSNKPATLLIASLLLAHISADASDTPLEWSYGWDANVWNTYCELKLDYKADSERQGFLANTGYKKAFVNFIALTDTHVNLYPESELSRIKFQFYIYSVSNKLPPPTGRVVSAKIGDFELQQPRDPRYGVYIFRLDEEASSTLLSKFRANERVDVVVRLANGDERLSTIYPSGAQDFHIWEAMFHTCIDKNMAPR